MTFLLNCALQVSLILLIAIAAIPCLRKKSAALRHCVLSCAIVFAALIPVFNLAMAFWKPAEVVAQHPAVRPIRKQISALTSPLTSPVANVPAPGPGGAPQQSDFVRRLPLWLWSIGAAAGLIVLVTGLARLARVASASGPVAGNQWTRLATLISREYGLKRPVRLLESRNASILVTWGFFRPQIIVPAGSAEWPEERTAIVLRHELAHVRRRDWVMQMIAQLFRIIYWFNPLVWIVCRRLRLESECACDDAVLSHHIEGHEYAGHLLELAQALNTRHRAWSAALTMAHQSTIERRFSAMLDPTVNRYPVTRLALFATVLIGLGITLSLSAASTAAPLAPALASPLPPPVVSPAVTPAPIQAPPPFQVVIRPKIVSPPQNPSTRRERGSALDRALFEVAGDGDISDIEELLRAGANVNAVISGDGTPLMAAAGDGHLEAVRFLLDRGADPNIPVPGDGNALIAAAEEGHIDVVRLLLDRGANPNAAVVGDGNPLIAAAREGHTDAVALLLDRGARIDEMVPGDENALIQASGEGHLDVVRLLVSRRADVNARVWIEATTWGPGGWRTPLSEARRKGHQDIVQFLISAGAKE